MAGVAFDVTLIQMDVETYDRLGESERVSIERPESEDAGFVVLELVADTSSDEPGTNLRGIE